jgi:hypothetical protein
LVVGVYSPTAIHEERIENMSAKGFLVGIKGEQAEIIYDGNPFGMRQEFKQVVLDGGRGYSEIFGYDSHVGPQPRKRRRFKGEQASAPVTVTETVADEFDTDPEPYVGPEPEPKPVAKKATKKRGKKKE